MREATIKGEVHRSDTDHTEVVELDLTDYDAVFVEGHKEPDDRAWAFAPRTVYYVAFAIYRQLTKRAYHDYDEVEQACWHLDVAYDDNIDLNPYETYESLWWPLRVVIHVVAFGSALGVMVVVFLLIALLAPEIPRLIGYSISVVVFALIVFLSEWVFVEGFGSLKRDTHMAETIQRRVDNDHRRILVVCGEMHRPDIAHQLKRAGWNVDGLPSRSWFAWVSTPYRWVRFWIWRLVFAPSAPAKQVFGSN